MLSSKYPGSIRALLAGLLWGSWLTSSHAAAPEPVFPLHTTAGKRYLVDAQEQPFLLQGDAAWSLIAQLNRNEAVEYLQVRKAQGFNAVLVNLIEHKFARRAPRNAYGEPPFLSAGDFRKPNPRYFAHADEVIAEAERRGILVLLAPAYLGFGGEDEGWYREISANGPAVLREYGRYVANQLRQRHNVLWVEGGDFNPPDLTLVRALVQGIQEVDPGALHTYHGARETAALEFVGAAERWLQVNDIYTTEDTVVDSAYAQYARSELPFFLIEARYEGEGYDAYIVRRQAYQAMLSGACGQVIGNKPVWNFGDGWRSALRSEGAHGASVLRELLVSLGWPDLLPDTQSHLVRSDLGGGGRRVVAARSADRSRAIIYVPDGRSVRVDLGQLGGPEVRIRGFNTVTGTFSAIPGSPAPASGEHLIAPPESGRASDWAIVLDSDEKRN